MFTNNMGAAVLFAVLFIAAVSGLLMLLAWLEQTPASRRHPLQTALAPRKTITVPRHRATPRDVTPS